MRTIKKYTSRTALFALLAIFAACKGETPTAPPTTTGGGVPGGTPPATGATVAIAFSNSSPVAESTTVVTVTVTVNGQPAPNGTAVELNTNLETATFTDTSAPATLRTTTNGVATATLTSPVAGPVVVTAVVGSTVRTAQVTFRAVETIPTTPSTAPTITSIAPLVGRPAGGEQVTINGTNLRGPVRVVFDYGNNVTREALVLSSSDTRIVVLSPPTDLGANQTRSATIRVFTQTGTASEQVVVGTAPFVYQSDVLTPRVVSVSPASGTTEGGTEVVIFGDGFQAPVQVFFGNIPTNIWHQVQVINVTFNRIVVVTPPSRATSASGNESITGPVDVRVVNVNSATQVEIDNLYRYTPGIQITAVGPTEGPFTGGTTVTIDGVGFEDPVAVSIAGVAALPIRVSGTQIVAITSGVSVTSCADVTGPVVVTSVNTGVSSPAPGPTFIYRVPRPTILGVTGPNPLVPGSPIQITVLNGGLFPQLTIGNRAVTITSTTQNPNGTTTYTTTAPTSLPLGTTTCPAGGSQPTSASFDVVFTNAESGCTTTRSNGLTVQPPSVGVFFTNPNPLSLTARQITTTTTIPPVPPATTPTTTTTVTPQNATGTFTIVNNGAGPVTITGVTSSNPGVIDVTNDVTGQVLQPCAATVVAVRYTAQPVGSTNTATIAITGTSGATTVTGSETVVGTTTP